MDVSIVGLNFVLITDMVVTDEGVGIVCSAAVVRKHVTCSGTRIRVPSAGDFSLNHLHSYKIALLACLLVS